MVYFTALLEHFLLQYKIMMMSLICTEVIVNMYT